MRSIRASNRAVLTALALLAAAPAESQTLSSMEPGALLDRPVSKKEQMDQAVENARWRVGPFRLAPWLAVRDAAYVSDVFSGTRGGAEREEEPDFTISVGAGLQSYLPLGPKAFFTLEALPQYVWWQEQDERRRLNGLYGAGLFGFFNRLTATATAHRADEQGVVTPEYQQRIHTRRDGLDALLELEVSPALFVFASGSTAEFTSLVDDLGEDPRLPAFQELDRDERRLRGGVEYRYRERLRLAAGVERSAVEFAGVARDRSNSGTSPLFELGYENPHLDVRSSLVFRSLEPEEGSRFEPLDETTGRVQVAWTPRWRFGFAVYGSRDFMYSLDEGYSHFLIDRLGLAVTAKLGRASAVDLFAETGGHDYAASLAGLPDRDEDFSAYGTRLRLDLRERVRLTAGITRTEIDSALPGFDRSLTTFQTSLEVSAFGGSFTVR